MSEHSEIKFTHFWFLFHKSTTPTLNFEFNNHQTVFQTLYSGHKHWVHFRKFTKQISHYCTLVTNSVK